MPIKTTIIEPEPQQEEIKFPVLAESKNSTLVVMFLNRTLGVVVVEGENANFGDCNQWEYVYSRGWRILPKGSKVILEQE